MDLTLFTDAGTDLTAAVATTGAALVGIYIAVKTFPFIMGWAGKLYNAARGRAGS